MSKKFLFLSVASILILTGCGCQKKEQIGANEENNVNEEVLKEQQVGSLKIYDVQMELNTDNTIFTIYMQNTSDTRVDIGNFKINFKDKNDKYLLSEPVLTPFYSSIEAGEIQALSVYVRQNLSDAVSVEYEIVD